MLLHNSNSNHSDGKAAVWGSSDAVADVVFADTFSLWTWDFEIGYKAHEQEIFLLF